MKVFKEALLNPLYPPILGDIEAGGHPQTPDRMHPMILDQRLLNSSLELAEYG